jgi:cytochrome P450/NADPH-cytochrome P450 reductase
MLGHQRRYADDIRTMNEVADSLIRHRRDNPLPDDQSDVLDTMLGAQDPKTGETLSDENVRNQMVTFLIAGHETTSGLLSFALYELLTNPNVLATAQAHVDEVLDGRFPDYADLPRLGYLDQVLRETLRRWPTAPAFGLYPYEPTTIGGCYRVDPTDTVLVLTPSLHRDPAAWEEPERFDPDRFAFERAARIPSNAWKPFGNGQRSCIGRGFALQEAQLVLALLLQRFDPALADPSYELKIKETLTLKPDGLFVRLRRRPARAPGARVAAEPVRAQHLPAPSTVERHGTPVQVLYGSNAGTSEAFARQIAARASQLGFAPTVHEMDKAAGGLITDGPVIAVTASYEGQPPDNARAFVGWLDQAAEGSLRDVRYAVFGCGNTDWARTYQRIPALVDESLARAGAQRIVARGQANARGDFFGDFEAWHEGLWPAIASTYGVTVSAAEPAPAPLRVEIVGPGREPLLRDAGLEQGVLVENRELVDMTRPGSRSKHHLEIALPAGQTYRAGDYLAVMPLNPSMVVDRALARFGLAHDTRLQITAEETHLPVDGPVTAGELFAGFVELTRPAGRRQVEQLADHCPCPPERQALLALAQQEVYQTEVLDKRVSLLDLLEKFASIQLPLPLFLAMLTPLSPRQYSISSSPRWRDDHATLTVAHLDAPALSGQGRYEGVASTYLANARPGTRISIAVRPSNIAFHPPADITVPIVLICAGSGLAPFRGFLQDRALQARNEAVTPGPALLFFGCDAPDVDLLYSEELSSWEAQGIVSVRPAFSQAPQDGPNGPMRFVQDRLWADRSDVAELVRQGAHVYVCGDGRSMAPAVHDTCVRMYAEATGCSSADAEAWMAQMEREHGRYVCDAFI